MKQYRISIRYFISVKYNNILTGKKVGAGRGCHPSWCANSEWLIHANKQVVRHDGTKHKGGIGSAYHYRSSANMKWFVPRTGFSNYKDQNYGKESKLYNLKAIDSEFSISNPVTFSNQASWVDVQEIVDPENIRYQMDVRTQGQGKVTRDPKKDSFKKDEKATLTATPVDGWVFESWSGDAGGKMNPLTVTLDASKGIVANFLTENGKKDLIINGDFSTGADPWAFNKWSGDASGTVENGEYKITINTVGTNYYDIQLSVYDLNGNIVHSANIKTHTGFMQNYDFSTACISKGYYVMKVLCDNVVHKKGVVLTGNR